MTLNIALAVNNSLDRVPGIFEGEEMKATITRGGYIKIEAETIEEAFAMKYLMPTEDKGGIFCDHCGQLMGQRLIFSTEILEKDREVNGQAFDNAFAKKE